MSIERADTIFWGLSFVALGHVPVFYETPLPSAVLVVWYVALNLIGFLTIAEEFEYPTFVRTRSDPIDLVTCVSLVVALSIISIYMLFPLESTIYSLLAVVGAITAIAIAWSCFESFRRTVPESDGRND